MAGKDREREKERDLTSGTFHQGSIRSVPLITQQHSTKGLGTKTLDQEWRKVALSYAFVLQMKQKRFFTFLARWGFNTSQK